MLFIQSTGIVFSWKLKFYHFALMANSLHLNSALLVRSMSYVSSIIVTQKSKLADLSLTMNLTIIFKLTKSNLCIFYTEVGIQEGVDKMTHHEAHRRILAGSYQN